MQHSNIRFRELVFFLYITVGGLVRRGVVRSADGDGDGECGRMEHAHGDCADERIGVIDKGKRM